jgi:hypothetical protein
MLTCALEHRVRGGYSPMSRRDSIARSITNATFQFESYLRSGYRGERLPRPTNTSAALD